MIYYSLETDPDKFMSELSYGSACFARVRRKPQNMLGIQCHKTELARNILSEWNSRYKNLPMSLFVYKTDYSYRNGIEVRNTAEENFIVVRKEFTHLDDLDSAWLIPFTVVRVLDANEHFSLGRTKTLRGLIRKGMKFTVHNICNPDLPIFSALRCINDVEFIEREKKNILVRIMGVYKTVDRYYYRNDNYSGLSQSDMVKTLGEFYDRKRRN